MLSTLPVVPSPDLLVRSATGWPGLALILLYSFLVAVVLPFPGELVLLAPIELGLPGWGELALVVGVSAAGKAAGSVFALSLGNSATRTGHARDLFERFRVDVLVALEDRLGEFVRDHGYLGLTAALAVPGSPDTVSIYAFSAVETEYPKFAAAAFVGTVLRLLVVVGIAGGLLAVV
ncbi:VTT domain-containing protein [Halospeciosus flavus]|uniref:VTT domain-containing protein n=1 Tax=Halospeciosus flavus TaxID=3032283 RepID=A0ABD5Z5B2_9EURY|nr:VTT domain-containing protein [Halospeciosus flavus]